MAKPILILAAIAALWPVDASAQARLNGNQLAYRMLHPDCIFPDLQDNPDFRLCGRHFLGDSGIGVVKGSSRLGGECDGLCVKVQDFGGEPYSEQEPYPAALQLDSAWLQVRPSFRFSAGLLVPPDRHQGGSHSLEFRVTAYARDAAGRPVERRSYSPVLEVPHPQLLNYVEGGYLADHADSVNSMNDWLARSAAIYGCASIDECLAAYPWYYNTAYPWYYNPQSWGSLTNDQVARVARVIQLRIVNDGCNVGLSAQPPSDIVVLTKREDGRISGRCEPIWWQSSSCWKPDHDRPGNLCIGQPDPEPEGYRP